MNIKKILGLFALGGVLVLAAPAERAEALSPLNAGIAAALQDPSAKLTTEVRWHGHHGWHHRHWGWRHHGWRHRHWGWRHHRWHHRHWGWRHHGWHHRHWGWRHHRWHHRHWGWRHHGRHHRHWRW